MREPKGVDRGANALAAVLAVDKACSLSASLPMKLATAAAAPASVILPKAESSCVAAAAIEPSTAALS